ncbi:RNA polymerase sigma factor [Janthinobacterium fluminis]|uniref:Sigma-70 family RNA polymerase sigma factor n=1 Tax=Janthinobacterium fluminis TaxID=2987524 RepID=A0ABT5JUH9_9BURK|nr:sigma-70 family RNA polymerase sigma factor [Janthinobacterium fluminis]MDC8756369.1 sigma-70 family RNA polymerase sigma factor [Janthinobacterium fluminis]
MFERYYQELLRLMSRATGCRDKAQDVVQEAYARVLAAKRGGHAPAPDGSERALLYVTARNIVIDQQRYHLHRQHEDIEHHEPRAPRADEPEQRLADRQNMDRLLAIIDNLPPRCRQAFALYKFDGLSHIEIAAQMGISVNMVEKHIINGMVACKKALAEGSGA